MGDGGAPRDKSVVPCNEIDYRPRPSLPYDVPSLDPGSRYAEGGTFLRGVLRKAGPRDSQRNSRMVQYGPSAREYPQVDGVPVPRRCAYGGRLGVGSSGVVSKLVRYRRELPLPHPPPIQTAILNRLTNM